MFKCIDSFTAAIYFLLPGAQVSALHRIKSDEIWHFYAGAMLTLTLIHPDGRLEMPRLGPDPGRGESFQVLVPAGCWYGASVDDLQSYAHSLIYWRRTTRRAFSS